MIPITWSFLPGEDTEEMSGALSWARAVRCRGLENLRIKVYISGFAAKLQ